MSNATATVITPATVRECQVLSFAYNGKPRVCMVLEVADTWFRGQMADGSGYRCFSFDKLESDMVLVTEPE